MADQQPPLSPNFTGGHDDNGKVTGSYPITSNPTGHRVRVGNQTINAMCAIDALGIGAMYDQDVRIQLSCRNCSTEIQIDTADKGLLLKTTAPQDTSI